MEHRLCGCCGKRHFPTTYADCPNRQGCAGCRNKQAEIDRLKVEMKRLSEKGKPKVSRKEYMKNYMKKRRARERDAH